MPKRVVALLLFWFVAGKVSTPAEYLEPLRSNRLAIDPYVALFAQPYVHIHLAQIQTIKLVYKQITTIEGSNCAPLSYKIRHNGTSIDLLSTNSRRDYNVIWSMAYLKAQGKLFYEIEVDEDTLDVFYHITPLSPRGTN